MERKEFARKMGEKVAHYRKQKNVTQAELAYRVGREPQDISNFEKGRFVMSVFMAYRIARALEVSLDALTEFD